MTLSDPLRRYRAMITMRAFEEACVKGSMSQEIHGEIHIGIGQEAVAAGMIGSLEDGDAIVSTHRNHCHGIAKGVPLHPFLAEIFEKETGLCRGRGGHMHPFDREKNFSATGIVGSSLPVALGYAYAFRLEGNQNVAVGVVGEGGANAGTFHECMNIAAAWNLPFVILVENNNYAISVPFEEVSATSTIAERAGAFGAPGECVDGTNVETVASAFARATEHARSGKGPAVLEANCFRFRGHYEGDHDGYRDKAEMKNVRAARDPIKIARANLLEQSVSDAAELDSIEVEAQSEIAAILSTVKSDPMPEASGALRYRFVGE